MMRICDKRCRRALSTPAQVPNPHYMPCTSSQKARTQTSTWQAQDKHALEVDANAGTKIERVGRHVPNHGTFGTGSATTIDAEIMLELESFVYIATEMERYEDV